MTPLFSHSGAVGDIIASLWFCRDAAPQGFRLHLQYGVKIPYKGGVSAYGDVIMSKAAAEALAPLLQAQPNIQEVTLGPDLPEGAFDLGSFRRLPLNLMGADLREFYYQLQPGFLPGRLWEPVLNFPARGNGKVVVFLTDRYRNPNIDLGVLRPLAIPSGRLIFCGTEKEHKAFEAEYFPVDFAATADFLQAAALVAGADLTIANPTAGYWLAEALKTPRILLSSDVMRVRGGICAGPVNINPLGGVCGAASTTAKLAGLLAGL